MRLRCVVTAVVTSLLAIGAPSAQQARADDYYPDQSFDVVSATATPSTVKVSGRETKPVTITVTTRTAEGYEDRSGTVMALTEAWQVPQPADLSATLQLVGQKDGTKQWRGVVHVGGPSRVVKFDGAFNCEFGCNLYPTTSDGPRIRVQSTESPVLTLAKPTTTDLSSRSYTVSGRVLTSSKRSYGRPIPVHVAYGLDCTNTDAGVVARTTADGRFRATVSNRTADLSRGLPVMQRQCVKVLADARDIRNRPTFLAYGETDIPWKTTLPIRAPKSVKRGSTAIVSSAALLPTWTVITLERLHGRTAWRPVDYSRVRPGGRISSYIVGNALGRHVYRIRNDDSRAMSEPFAVTTTR